MYANRDTAVPVVPVVPVRPQRNGLAALPVLALSCLLFILFLIAATIVLALIPVYIQTAQATRRSTSATRLATAQVPGTLPDGSIDAASRTSLANAIATAQGLPAGSVTVTGGNVATPGKRKRRGLLARSERQVSFKILTFTFVYNLIICGAHCTTAVILAVAITLINIVLTVGGVTITIAILTISVTATTVTIGSSGGTGTTSTTTASSSTSTSASTSASTSTSTVAAQTTAFTG